MKDRTFGDVLLEIRSQHGLTQERFAKFVLGSAKSAARVKVAEYEIGKAVPSSETLQTMVSKLKEPSQKRELVSAWLRNSPGLIASLKAADLLDE